jgi:hypothetical protein
MLSEHRCAGCGRSLSRYNDAALCGPCQRTAAVQPAAIPPQVWEQPDVRRALDTLDFPALFTSLRAHTRMRQSELAALAGKTQSDWSLIESGRRRIVHIDAIVSVLTGLGVPADLVRLPLPPSKDSAARRAAA